MVKGRVGTQGSELHLECLAELGFFKWTNILCAYFDLIPSEIYSYKIILRETLLSFD